MRPIFGRSAHARHSVGGTLVGGTLVGAPTAWSGMGGFATNPAVQAMNLHPAVAAAVQAAAQGASPAQQLQASQGSPVLMNPGPTQGRVQTLGFPTQTVATTASSNASSAPQVWFRPDRLFLPSNNAAQWTVTAILIGNKSQLLNGNPLTGAMFSELAVDSAISYDTCDPAVTITIGLTNNSTGTISTTPSMLGRSAY